MRVRAEMAKVGTLSGPGISSSSGTSSSDGNEASATALNHKMDTQVRPVCSAWLLCFLQLASFLR